MNCVRPLRLLAVCVLLAAALCSLASCQPVPPAKHVILMVADGGGFNHAQAASLYRTGQFDREVWQQFPVRLACSTFPAGGSYDPARLWQGFDYAKSGYTDSAAAATALACGVKTKYGSLGVDPRGRWLPNLSERAEKLGRATGLVSTVFFSDATPAGFAAHVRSRKEYAEITHQMVDRSAVDVVLAAGNPEFDNDGKRLAQPDYEHIGETTWQALKAGTAGGDADGDGRPDAWKLLQTRADFLGLLSGTPPRRVFGLAQAGGTLQEGRRSPADNPATTALPFTVPCNANVPTLTEMTQGALRVLASNPKGFFLMVEGGAVDWAAHDNLSGREVEEELAFGDAVAAVCAWVEKYSNWKETLLVVTADHETGGLTGPGSGPDWKPLVNHGRGKLPGMEWHSDNHTNSLVPCYARGAGAERLVTYATGRDPVRGAYLDNTDVSRVLRTALQ